LFDTSPRINSLRLNTAWPIASSFPSFPSSTTFIVTKLSFSFVTSISFVKFHSGFVVFFTDCDFKDIFLCCNTTKGFTFPKSPRFSNFFPLCTVIFALPTLYTFGCVSGIFSLLSLIMCFSLFDIFLISFPLTSADMRTSPDLHPSRANH